MIAITIKASRWSVGSMRVTLLLTGTVSPNETIYLWLCNKQIGSA